jgi:hypothetical protein
VSASIRDTLLDPAMAAGGVPLGLDESDRLAELVSEAAAVAKSQLAGPLDEQIDAQIVIRNLMAIMGHAVVRGHERLLADGIAAAIVIWDVGDRSALYRMNTSSFEASLWEGMGIELYALGGLAVQHERWAAVRSLTLQYPTTTGENTWLREGQVVSARAGQPAESLLGLAAVRLGALEPRLTEDQRLRALARFDFLSGLMISESHPTRFYPNAAEFSEELVEPLIIEELRRSDSALRQHVFSGDDQGVREALRYYNERACSQAALQRYAGLDWSWRAFADGRTWSFIDGGQLVEEPVA